MGAVAIAIACTGYFSVYAPQAAHQPGAAVTTICFVWLLIGANWVGPRFVARLQGWTLAFGLIPVLLAGGSGTRLWPVSRDGMPKQFMPIVGKDSTFQQALLRLADPRLFAPAIVMTVGDFRFFARRQAEDIGREVTVVLEPERRDSAPAWLPPQSPARRRDPDAIVLALAADHVILDPELFHAACISARKAAEAGSLGSGFGLRLASARALACWRTPPCCAVPNLGTNAGYLEVTSGNRTGAREGACERATSRNWEQGRVRPDTPNRRAT